MFNHAAITEWVEKAVPGMLYEQRKLLEQRDYPALLMYLKRAIRDTKLLTLFMSAVVMSNPLIHGFNTIRRTIRDGGPSGDLYAVLAFVATAVIVVGVFVAFQMSRLAAMERARFALEIVTGESGAEKLSGAVQEQS